MRHPNTPTERAADAVQDYAQRLVERALFNSIGNALPNAAAQALPDQWIDDLIEEFARVNAIPTVTEDGANRRREVTRNLLANSMAHGMNLALEMIEVKVKAK